MKSFLLALIATAAVAAALLSGAEAACVASELSPCLPAITQGSAPTKLCCDKLTEQQPCFCQYLKDPNLRKYVDSPNAKKVAAQCHVSFPKC